MSDREPGDITGLVSDMQRQIVISHLKQEALAEAMKVLVDSGPAAAVEVLERYAERIVRLGGTFEERPEIPQEVEYVPRLVTPEPQEVPSYEAVTSPPAPAPRLKQGTRVELITMADDTASLEMVPPGTAGTVAFVDDLGTIHVKWDNGVRIGLLPNQDSFKVLA